MHADGNSPAARGPYDQVPTPYDAAPDPQDAPDPTGGSPRASAEPDRPPEPGQPADPAAPTIPGESATVLAELVAAGFPVAEMDAEQRAVLAALSREELSVLLDVKRRLDSAEPEVLAHEASVVGGLFF